MEQSEQSEEQRSAVSKLRRSVVLSIAEREVRKAERLPVEKPATGDSAA
ncbi:MAG TPA: hypothetical protein VGG96_01695 [Steroidobacteraceae bacterium]